MNKHINDGMIRGLYLALSKEPPDHLSSADVDLLDLLGRHPAVQVALSAAQFPKGNDK